MAKLQICILYIVCNLLIVNCNLDALAQEKIIAVVNKEIITQKDFSDFANFMRMQLSRKLQGQALEEEIESMKPDLLEKLVEDRLILQEAKNKGIKIDESLLKGRVNEIKSRYRSDAEFQQDLFDQGMVLADLEDKIREQLLMQAVIEAEVTKKIIVRPDEVTGYYNKNMDDFVVPQEREVETVMFENKDLADSFSYSLKSGEKLDDLTARYPVVIDSFQAHKTGELKQDIEDIIFNLSAGEISDIAKVEDKYYIFKLINIAPSRKLTLAEAQEQINTILHNKKMQESMKRWLDSLREKSYIKIIREDE